jgi:hypothetical protein
MLHSSKSHMRTIWPAAAILVGLAAFLGACTSMGASAEIVCPEVECPTQECPEPERYEDIWAESAHADTHAVAFTHWNDANPREIPVECAKCHSRPGFIDYLGIDGSPTGLVDRPVEVGSTLTCYVCHNEVVGDVNSVTFPSGIKIRGVGEIVSCIECHQGQASVTTIDQALASIGLPDEDTPSPDLTFISSHAISAATPFGGEAGGAYQYIGKPYQGRYLRGGEFFSCIQCHDPHRLEVNTDTCSDCHTITGDDIHNIRVDTTDYDGNGNISEGIAIEIESFQERLLSEIRSYAQSQTNTAIVYDPGTYPYYFLDTNRDGVADPDEIQFENRYNVWTPRLLKAAYNYDYVIHDPGAFAHNSDYILQILYDSITDLSGNGSGLTRPPVNP